jgi:hypothetical protein
MPNMSQNQTWWEPTEYEIQMALNAIKSSKSRSRKRWEEEEAPSWLEVWNESLATKGLTKQQADYFRNKTYNEFNTSNPDARQKWWDTVREAEISREDAQADRMASGITRSGIASSYADPSIQKLWNDLYNDIDLNAPGGSPVANLGELHALVGNYGKQDLGTFGNYYKALSPEQLSKVAALNRFEGLAHSYDRQDIPEAPRLKDPWAATLEDYPFMQEWYGMSPGQRGTRAGWINTKWNI